MRRTFGYRCQYCEGTVREKRVGREAFKYKARFVILEGVVIGVCDNCGNRYYSADTLKRVEAIATGKVRANRRQTIPVASAR